MIFKIILLHYSTAQLFISYQNKIHLISENDIVSEDGEESNDGDNYILANKQAFEIDPVLPTDNKISASIHRDFHRGRFAG